MPRLIRGPASLVAGLAALIVASGAAAQKHPDFTGAWTASPTPASNRMDATRGSPGSGWGRSFTIRHDVDRLTVERAFFSRSDIQPPLRLRYALDGSPSQNTLMMGRGMQESRSTAAWSGDTLVVTTEYQVPLIQSGDSLTSEVTRKLWLQPDRLPAWPSRLVIETTRSSILGGSPSTTRTVYTRN